MSARLFKKDILFLQRFLAVAGFYDGVLDGRWRPALDEAEEGYASETGRIRNQLGAFDSRTEASLTTLIPAAQSKAREFMRILVRMPLRYRILSGTRTYAEQDSLYAIGRTVQREQKPVTKAKGGQSNHNFGIAWDVGIFEDGTYYQGRNRKEQDAYMELGSLMKASVGGIEWGGDWASFVDMPHYQLRIERPVTAIRAMLEAGTAFA